MQNTIHIGARHYHAYAAAILAAVSLIRPLKSVTLP